MEQIRNLSGSFEYKKSKGSGYMFNDNGSLVADKCRGIAYITYDFNNNPRQIYFTNGSVTKYVYSASGRKLRVVHYTAVPNITRTWGVKPPELTLAQILLSDSVDYLLGGSMVMKNGRVDKYLFEGGYAQASVAGSTTDSFAFFYYNKDHLGSIREVVDANGNIRQVTNYYPFGAPYADSPVNPDHQPYKYNGKELDRMHGLDTYDYGARQHDPILARWDRMDPLCEKTPGISPYVYCKDNPVKFVDIDGRDGVKIIDDDNKTITVKADYYVRTGVTQYRDSEGNIQTLSGYSSNDINDMNNYNEYLNGLNLIIPSGDYEGYNLKFDLTFIDGGTTETIQAISDNYEGHNIGNSISKGTSQIYRNIGFEQVERPDGTTSIVGGVTQENRNIVMNVGYSGLDTKSNRIHEIFHTFGLSHPKGYSVSDGVMNYPPQKPSNNDALNVMNSSILPAINKKK